MPICAVAMYRSLPARVAQDALHEPRERLLPGGACVDRRPRRADDGEFRGDENGVEHDQRGDDQERDRHVTPRPPVEETQ